MGSLCPRSVSGRRLGSLLAAVGGRKRRVTRLRGRISELRTGTRGTTGAMGTRPGTTPGGTTTGGPTTGGTATGGRSWCSSEAYFDMGWDNKGKLSRGIK